MKGVYLLILRLDTELADLPIGRLGRYDFAPGYYLYVGSAFGSGGIAARVARHERAAYTRPRWHIDYFRPHAALVEAWCVFTAARIEACWAGRLAAAPELSIPAPGFGASDSRAGSHLLFAGRRPARDRIVEALTECFLQVDVSDFTLELRDY